MIHIINQISKDIVVIGNKVTSDVLEGLKGTVDATLNGTADLMRNLSDEKFLQIEDLPVYLEIAGSQINKVAENTIQTIDSSLNATKEVFDSAGNQLDSINQSINQTLHENKVLSSFLTSSHADLIGFGNVKLSFRHEGADITVVEAVNLFKNSGLKKAILYIPGFFCDERLWTKTEGDEIALADYFLGKGFFPFLINYNQAEHISHNGKQLEVLMASLFANVSDDISLDVIAFSQGGLVFRSAMYYSGLRGSLLAKKIGKAFLISCPHSGSYLEKLAFWTGIVMQISPLWPARVLGFLTNFRSDSIKDLSHGVIRDEDWVLGSPLIHFRTDYYHGELEDVNAYIIYSLLSSDDKSLQSIIGDGLVEKASLTALDNRLFIKNKDAADTHILKLHGYSHLKILNAPELLEYLERILLENQE